MMVYLIPVGVALSKLDKLQDWQGKIDYTDAVRELSNIPKVSVNKNGFQIININLLADGTQINEVTEKAERIANDYRM